MMQVGVMVCARGLVKANFIERVIVSGNRIEILYRKGNFFT